MISNLTKTEIKILGAANDVFLRYGFHGATLKQIAINAGVNKSAIHYYFRSKEILYSKIIKNTIDFIVSSDFTDNEVQKEYKRIRWFLSTELYNNFNLFSDTIKRLYPVDFEFKKHYIEKWLEYTSIYNPMPSFE